MRDVERTRDRARARAPRENLTGRPLLRRWLGAAALVVVFLVAALVLSVAIGIEVGGQATLLALLVAVLPLGIVVPAILWLDRFESEPPAYLVVTFAWGALIATSVAMVLNTGSALLLTVYDGSRDLAAVAVAPVVEEALKGLVVLLVLLFRRREFDGVVDGLVYAGLSAAGFAFAENVLYLGRAFVEGGPSGLVALFVIRGLLGPFAHPLFTMWIGIGVGVAATRRSGAVRVLAPVGGYLLAVTLHAVWNLSALAGIEGFWASYLLLQVPIFVGAIVVVVWARRREGRLIARHLVTYARYGWLTPPEVGMLTSVADRRRARTWARERGGRRGHRAMVAFQDDASELALLRERMAHGTEGGAVLDEERALLDSLTRARSAFLALPGQR